MSFKERKKILKEIEEMTSKDVILLQNRKFAGVDSSITESMGRVLTRTLAPKREEAILILETLGGIAEAGIEIMEILSNSYAKVTTAVYDRAKSAGTIMALCSDEILLGKNAHLGPIDVQAKIAVNFMETRVPLAEYYDILNEEGVFDPSKIDDRLLIYARLKYFERYSNNVLIPELAKHHGEEKAKAVHKALTTKGNHNTRVRFDELKSLGLPVVKMDSELEELVKQLVLSAEDELRDLELIDEQVARGRILLEDKKEGFGPFKTALIETSKKGYALNVQYVVDDNAKKRETSVAKAGWEKEKTKK